MSDAMCVHALDPVTCPECSNAARGVRAPRFSAGELAAADTAQAVQGAFFGEVRRGFDSDPPWITGDPAVPRGIVDAPRITVNEAAREELLRGIERLRVGPGLSPLVPQNLTWHAAGPTPEQFERLLWLLALSPEERAFVQAAATGDATTLLVFADWLEENRRVAEATRMRSVASVQPHDPRAHVEPRAPHALR